MRPCPEDSSDKKIRYPIIWKRKEKELMNTLINAQICSANAAFHFLEMGPENSQVHPKHLDNKNCPVQSHFVA
jgi:hypothetical protein